MHWLRGKKREWQSVVEMWDRFLADEPNEAKAYAKRAEAHGRLGHIQEELRDRKRACALGHREACR